MSSRDYFEFFELPRNLNIDAKDLEKRFYALSRKLHPDLFASKPQAERDLALESSAILNDAYRTLRDPIARTLYLLKQEGYEVAEQGTKGVPPELLEEVFELNMMLEDSPDAAELAAARQRFEGMRDSIDADMGKSFARWDSGHDRAALDEIRALLNKRKYVTNLIARTNVSD